jgi:RNA polymerase sigma-70 factor (ECF subfamily)
MADPHESHTRVTLLARLAQTGEPDQAAWEEFVDHYGGKVYQWCLRWRLQAADAEDVTQTVLLKLARRMKDFRYDPAQSFRAWLKAVTHNAWRDFVEDRQRPGRGQGSGEALDPLQTVEAREDLAERLEEQFDRELLAKAQQLVRLQVAPHNWQAFQLTAVEGVPAAEAARRLNMKVARVYAARSHIQQRLREECRRLEGEQDTKGTR